ncbi:putative ribonuclease H-like domain-containing protein [Tanacetum coccineum]|uniref:Ribonuclease H-like domain-containing protein n=1 Tax=Tanacetum coccineum TaxID=301880 RepID=A0ABQ5DLR4_9ASTR
MSLLEALHEMFPKSKLPSSTYQAKKLICLMGMEIEKIDVCPKDCMLYRDNDKDMHACRICGKSRYKRKKDTPLNPDVTKNGPPAKILWYLPIKPRLERLFSNENDEKLLRWHAEERKRNGKMRHVADSLQWRNIDNRFKEFRDEIRNIRFGFSSDEINPFRNMSSRHSTWPERLQVRHCLDVMYIEKNVCESLIGLLLNISGKTKDEVKVRKDMEAMKIRPELAPREIVGKTSTYLPPACYTMSKAEKTKFCQCLSEIKVPSRYSANIKTLVSMQDLKLFGMKSHDCHVLMTQMIPIAIRGILPDRIRHTITKLCLYFNKIHLKLEMYFPPSLFDVMVHLVSHIVGEIKTYGPTFLRNMYPFNRYMGFLKGYVRNRSRPEGSIIEGYATEEAIEFYTDYLNGQDDKSTLQNSRVTLIASTTELSTVNREEISKNAKKAYYGVIQEIWELHYSPTVIPLFKFTNGVKSVVEEDEYDQFDEFLPFSIGITPSNDVLDDTTYLRSDHDEGLEKKLAIGKVYAKQQMSYARLGRSRYRRMDVDLSKVELDEALKEEMFNITCDHTRNWILARITSPNISTNMEELFRKLDGSWTNSEWKKGAGTFIVGATTWKLSQRDAERDAKRDAERDAARDAERDVARDAAKDAEIEVESNVEREASNEGRVQKRQKQSSCESTTVVHKDKEKLKDIKDSTPIARGMVYLIGDGTIHGGPLIPYYMKVSVDTFVAAFGDTKLPIFLKADDTITMLKQSVGSFLQWPRCRISPCLENTPTSKDTSQRATLQPTLATSIPVAQEITPLMPALQTPTKQPYVRAAYVRWTARNNDIADHILEVPGGMIVGHEDTFHVPISTEDIMNLWNLDGLNSSILLYFEWRQKASLRKEEIHYLTDFSEATLSEKRCLKLSRKNITNIELKRLGVLMGFEKRLSKLQHKSDIFSQSLIDEIRSKRSSSSSEEGDSKMFIDAMLSLQDSEPHYYTDDIIKGNVLDSEPVITYKSSKTNGIARTRDNIVTGQAEKKTKLKQEYIIIPFCTTDPLISQGPKDSKKDSRMKPIEVDVSQASDRDGEDDQASRSEFERLLQQEKQIVHPNSTNSINIVSTPVSTIGPSFTNDAPSSPVNDARTSEEHLFEQFSPFKNAFTLLDVLNVFSIDDTRIFCNDYDNEDVGVEADLNNLETTMNVSPILTTRIDKDHRKDQIIGDLNSAIQTRRMTKISDEHAMVSYINKQRRTNHKDYQNCLFACFLSKNEPKKVIQALEDPSWIEAMQEEFLQFQLQKVWTLVNLPNGKRAIGTKWVFKNKKDERVIIIRNKARLMDVKCAFLYGTIKEEVYVCQPPGFEDPQLPDKVYKVEKALYGLHQAHRAWYETLSTYLIENGFRRGTIDKTLFIKLDKGDILLVQVYVDDIIFGSTKKSLCDEFEDKYVAEILKKFDFAIVKTASTPIGPNKALVKDEEADSVDVHLYRSMIRSLMYLTASRPDITFAVCACARFQVTPKTSHLHYVNRIFRYLKGQPKLGLWYPRDSPFDLEAFSDSDYAVASLDRKSTIGGYQFLGKRLISWQCKKQTIVANSTTKAEYVAAANCCRQVFKDGFDGCIGLKMLFGPVLRVKHGKKFVSAIRLALCCWAKVSTVRHRVSAARQT